MVQKRDIAPEFSLPGYDGGEFTTYSLSDSVAQNRIVLLLFYPFDFSPVCTNELCAIRDAEFFQFTNGVDVWAVSGDSVYAHRAFMNEYELNFPLLSDSHGEVAAAYDVCYDEWEHHERIPKRAVFLIGPDQEIEYAWHTDDAFEKPDFFPVKEALDTVVAERENFSFKIPDLSVDYSEGPGEVV